MLENKKSPSIPGRFPFMLALGTLLIFVASKFSIVSAMPPTQATDGEALFKEKCVACHTIGGGDLVGPDLKGATERRTKEWLTNWISAPDQMLASGDPTATELFNTYNKVPMPNLALTPDQVSTLITYLGSGVSPATTTGLPAGDAASGKAYFVGDKRFENGGPHCISCHSVAGIGSLGGGNLGPDLTNSGYVQSDAAFAGFIGAPSTVTMGAVWANAPLTKQEQADLYAFLSKATVQRREPSALLQIALLGAGGAAALIALAQLYWGRRLKGVRREMIARTFAAKR